MPGEDCLVSEAFGDDGGAGDVGGAGLGVLAG